MSHPTTKQKPSIEEVLEYAEKQIKIALFSYARYLPEEQKEEIAQNARMRLFRHYEKMDPALGIKSYIQIHCRGAAQDYLRAGLNDTESEFNQDRVEIISKDEGEMLEVDETAGLFGIFAEMRTQGSSIKPNWEILSRLAGADESLHITCKALLGYSHEQISEQLALDPTYGVTRERITQRIHEFFKELDAPINIGSKKIEQYIFALGMSDFFHIAEVDNGYGWELKEFDLNMEDSFILAREHYNLQTGFTKELGRMAKPEPVAAQAAPRPSTEHDDAAEQISLFEVMQ